MNNLAPMKICPGGVQGNPNCMPGYTVLFVPCSLEITCWERIDLLALLCAMIPCVFGIFPYGNMSQT